MAMYKCKMCGGTLEISNENATVAECEYCGTQQTLPTSKDENLQSLFNRANTLRIKSEFDKAEQIYEKILQVKNDEAEAYWGLILCKYGIEYVEDPATFKRLPTCHRTSYDSIIADDDFKSALEYADGAQRAVYESEAKAIDAIQKDILAISQKEEPYDVFICYKETDESGKRTQDSVVANDIYYQLTQEGFKVFYAAITLEYKLGSAYEPCIFAALNSAKVMLAIGTKPEHFNAVWVKNEWSRYLKMMKKDRSKTLIPCYKGMDAYELPEEFAHLQAQDMGKIGFINDIVRGIKKVIVKEEVRKTVVEQVPTANASTAPLLERAFMFLEDGEWAKADDFCEQVLNLDPKCAEAYLGKLMAELRVNKRENLENCEQPFDSENNYQKVMRFGDNKLKTELVGYIDHINTCKEIARKDAIYGKGRDCMLVPTLKQQKEAILLFEQIPGYIDTDELIAKCRENIENIKHEEEEARIATEKQEKKNKKIADIIILAIVIVVAVVILITQVIVPAVKYSNAVSLYEDGKYEEAIAIFTEIGDYKDSIDIRSAAMKEIDYLAAIELYEERKYQKATDAFTELGNYKDSKDYLVKCNFILAEEKITKITSKAIYEKLLETYSDMPSDFEYNGIFASERVSQLKMYEDVILTYCGRWNEFYYYDSLLDEHADPDYADYVSIHAGIDYEGNLTWEGKICLRKSEYDSPRTINFDFDGKFPIKISEKATGETLDITCSGTNIAVDWKFAEYTIFGSTYERTISAVFSK